MLFNSYVFILLFLPISILGYFGLNALNRNVLSKVWLLCMSLYFYSYFNFSYLYLIISSIIVNYSCSLIFQKNKGKFLKVLLYYSGLLFNLGMLFYFKYFDFFISNINVLFKSNFMLHNLILPLGISFFTFQQLSFLIDSYRGEIPRYNLLDYSLFVCFFPQLIAGPIVTHDEIVPQFALRENNRFDYENFSKGIYAFSLGLAKKVLIADTFGNTVNWAYLNIATLNSTNAMIAMIAYTLQIYFDFSGYCDMALGLGLMFNINIAINFNSPYKATSILDFWKRWHITLTRFFTRYIYIPLGGNRRGEARTMVNIFIVYLISGLWHGANWTFILWGIMHGMACIITRLLKKQMSSIPARWNWFITFCFINFSWIFFRAVTIADAVSMIKKIFSFNFGAIAPEIISCFNTVELRVFQLLTGLTIPNMLLVFGPIIISLIIVIECRNTNERVTMFSPTIKTSLITVLLLTWSIISFSGVSTFLYFNF